MISDINVWRVILHNSAKDENGQNITNNDVKERLILNYYINNNVVAIGWAIDEDLAEDKNTFEAYKSYANEKYKNRDYKYSVLPFGERVGKNDLIWAKSENKYYIAKVSDDSKWQYNGEETAKRLDVVNQITNIKWKILEDGELLSELKKVCLPNNWTQTTFQRIKDPIRVNFSKKAYNKVFNEHFYEVKTDTEAEILEITELLERNKNLILQGAPGTGKTYKTAELALHLIGAIDNSDTQPLTHQRIMELYDEYVQKGQIEFVTFHQSMDYEDFIEGLKPELVKNSDDENVGINYSVKTGVFKRICDVARSNIQRNADIEKKNETAFENAWDRLIEKLNNDEKIDIPLQSQNKKFVLTLNKTGTGLSSKPINATNSDYTNYYTKEQLFNVFGGRNGVPSGGHDNYRKAIIAYMKDSLELGEYENAESSSGQQKYVLIIDEINRGNVSKIFGELISLIEKDKREPVGKDSKSETSHPLFATLPYSKERFSVPSNLYIIGTMNTTDRSVGGLDYALRRRFAFYTIKSDRKIVEQYGKTAVDLFDAVYNFIKDNSLEKGTDDLMVGHSYFKIDNTDEENGDELEQRWEYEIKPLLMEYYKDGIIQENVGPEVSSIEKFIKTYKETNQNYTQLQDSNTSSSDNSVQGAQK